MSESAKPFSVSIHELLRYAIPGYSFLIVLYLHLIFVGASPLTFQGLEHFISLFLVGGLVIGYFIYYLYYRLFISRVYNLENRKSLREARNLMFDQTRRWEEIRWEVLAVHSRALHKEEGRIRYSCLFQFSVFHSIGTMLFSIWIAYFFSILWALWIQIIPQLGFKFWGAEGLTAVILSILSYALWREYGYRTKLAIEIENQIVMLHLNDTVTEWQDQIEKGSHVCVTLKKEVVGWIDEQVKTQRFRNRSHATEVALMRFRETERKK